MQIPDDILTNPNAFKAFQENQGALTSALSRLMVVVERYPALTATQNFAYLQAQLEGTENRIAVALRDYIEAVRDYNTELLPLSIKAQELPTLTWRVVDGANIIDAGIERDLDILLTRHEQATGNQVVVVTVPDLQCYPTKEYALALGRGIGR